MRAIFRLLKWLVPALVLLGVRLVIPEMRSGDRREGSMSDPRSTLFMAALLYLMVVAGMGLVLWGRGLFSKREVRWEHTIQTKCPACGYDLRASPERCSECGTLWRFAGSGRTATTWPAAKESGQENLK